MAYSMGEIVRLRKQFLEQYDAGELQEAAHTGGEMMNYYDSHQLASGLEYAADAFNFALLLDEIGFRQKAGEYYVKAAQIQKKELGEESLPFADTISNLAVCYSLDGKDVQALPLFKKALRIRQALLPENHPDLILSFYNLGSSYENTDKEERAIGAFESALRLAEKQPEYAKKDYADLLSGLASVLAKKGWFKRAINCYAKAVEMMKIEEGEKTFHYLTTLLHLAAICDRAKCYDRAAVYYKRALTSRSGLLEKHHLDYIANLNSLAQVYLKKKEYDRAIETHQEALQLIGELLGKEHLFYAECINHIGMDYYWQGNYEEAMKQFSAALAIKQGNGKDCQLAASLTEECIADCLAAQGRDEEAEEAYEALYEKRKATWGEENDLVLRARMQHARYELKKGEFLRAKNLLNDAMALRRKKEMPKDMEMVFHYQALAETALALGEREEAIHRMNDALSVRRLLYGRNHPRYARGLYYRGQLEMKCGKNEDARRDLAYAMDIQKNMLGEENQDYKDTAQLLKTAVIRLMEEAKQAGRMSQAAAYLEQTLGLFTNCQKEERITLLLDEVSLFAKAGRAAEGLELLETVQPDLAEGNEQIQYLEDKGVLLSALGQYDLAQEALDQALDEGQRIYGKTYRLSDALLALLGENALEMDQWKKAREYFSTMQDSAKAVKNLGLGRCALARRAYQEAKAYFQTAWDTPEGREKTDLLLHHQLMGYLAEILEKTGEPETALPLWEGTLPFYRQRNLTGRKEYRRWLKKTALLMKQTQRPMEAAGLWMEYAELLPGEEKKQKAEALLQAGKLYFQAEDLAEGEDALLQALLYLEEESEQMPRLYLSALQALRRLYQKEGQAEKAAGMAGLIRRFQERQKEG